jgi:3-phenylpropionate/trans-cinnamate dioxygenase ferredoxin reductase component
MTGRGSGLREIVVVGACAAGTTAADTLRQAGFDGRLTLIGAETVPAYHRPALSKGVLTGAEQLEGIYLHPLGCAADQRLGTPAASLDLGRRAVVLADGDRVPFDGLVIATGARARRLAEFGTSDPNVPETTFRDIGDAQALAGRLARRQEIVIVGGGILGMELASACADRGSEVTVLDQQPPLEAQLGPALAGILVTAAVEHGVTIVTHPGGVRLRGMASPVAELPDGRRFAGDLVLSAVGCAPNTAWLAGTGLPVKRGVVVDSRGRVSDSIVAAGDVAAFPSAAGHRRTPLWNSALEQARTAALALLLGDSAPPLRPAGYFWTEQFGVTIRACGRLPSNGNPVILNGSPESGELVLQWSDSRGPVASAAVNKRVPLGKLRALAGTAPPAS